MQKYGVYYFATGKHTLVGRICIIGDTNKVVRMWPLHSLLDRFMLQYGTVHSRVRVQRTNETKKTPVMGINVINHANTYNLFSISTHMCT